MQPGKGSLRRIKNGSSVLIVQLIDQSLLDRLFYYTYRKVKGGDESPPLVYVGKIETVFLLPHALHAVLHTFRFALHVLAFEQAHIELAKAVVEVYTHHLRIPSSPIGLFKTI